MDVTRKVKLPKQGSMLLKQPFKGSSGRLVGLFDGFKMYKSTLSYFSLEEKLVQSLTQVISYFPEHL